MNRLELLKLWCEQQIGDKYRYCGDDEGWARGLGYDDALRAVIEQIGAIEHRADMAKLMLELGYEVVWYKATKTHQATRNHLIRTGDPDCEPICGRKIALPSDRAMKQGIGNIDCRGCLRIAQQSPQI